MGKKQRSNRRPSASAPVRKPPSPILVPAAGIATTPASSTFDVRKFRRTMQYSRRATVAELSGDLAALKNLDVSSEQQAAKYWSYAIGAGFAAVALAILTLFAYQSEVWIDEVVVGCLSVVSLLACFVLIWLYWHYYSTDVENRRYELAAGLLHFLGADIRPTTEVNLELGFLNYYRWRFFVHRGWGVKTYVMPWLRLKGKLSDGNRFEFTVELKVKRKTKWKRKYTKVKEAFAEHLTLELTLQNPPDDETLTRRLAQIPRPALGNYRAEAKEGKLILRGTAGHRSQVTGRGGNKSGHTKSSKIGSELDQYLRLFLIAYHCWNTLPNQQS